jgi:hypothetical protein
LRRDLACAALGVALAAAYWAAAHALPASMLSDAVGAGGVPKGVAVLLALLSLAIGARALAGRNGEATIEKNHLRALGIAILGFAYVAAAPLIGFFASIALLTGAAALYYGAPRSARTLAFALASAALLWLVFGRMLGIALP